MTTDLGQSIRHGLVWSMASALTLRLGSLVLGIALARLLSPEEFGVYAVALTVQTILITLVDLGLTADLVRSPDPARRAPTVATLGLVVGIALSALMMTASGAIADIFRSPDAASVIMVMSGSMIASGAGVVPLASLQRTFDQKKLFAASALDFVVGTGITVALVVVGLGPMALAIGRVTAQLCATVAMFRLSRTKPKFGFDRDEAGPALRFGVPVAAANLLSWALINVDNVVIARLTDEAALGLYVLAFNIATWPMNAIGQAVRAVSLPAFSRLARDEAGDGFDGRHRPRDPGLAVGTAFSWAAGVPAGVLLAALSVPLIHLLYGQKWEASAAVLAALGFFGSLRVLFDMMATYLLARGAARPVLWVQVFWMVTLIPAVMIGVQHFGIVGAAWAHVVTGIIFVLPAYLWAAARVGADTRAVVRVLVPPALAAIPSGLFAYYVSLQFDTAVLSLLVGGVVGLAIYSGLLFHWLRRIWTTSRNVATSPTQQTLKETI